MVERRFAGVYDLTAAEIQVILDAAKNVGQRFSNSAKWQASPTSDFSEREIAQIALSTYTMLHFEARERFTHESYIPPDSIHEDRYKDHQKRLSLKNAMALRLISAFSTPIAQEMVRQAHNAQGIHSEEEYMKVVAADIGGIEQFSDISKVCYGPFDSELLEDISSDVFFKIQLYIRSLEDSEKTKYRRKAERPRPDLPANHYYNLKAVGMGVRSAPPIRDAVDEAVKRSPVKLSRNEWVNAAIEEKLLLDHPDIFIEIEPGDPEP